MTTRATTPPAEMSGEEFEEYLGLPASERPVLSFEDYLALPGCDRRLDVIDGVIVMSPSATLWHQDLIQRLLLAIRAFITPRDLGRVIQSPSDVLIRRHPKLRVRQPDLYFVTSAKLEGLDLKRTHILEVAPDLAIEVTSPNDREDECLEKLADYAAIEIREVWRVAPETEAVEVLELIAGQYARVGVYDCNEVLNSIVLPGLAIPLGPLFVP